MRQYLFLIVWTKSPEICSEESSGGLINYVVTLEICINLLLHFYILNKEDMSWKMQLLGQDLCFLSFKSGEVYQPWKYILMFSHQPKSTFHEYYSI